MMRSALTPYLQGYGPGNVVLPLMINAIFIHSQDSERYFSFKSLRHWNDDEDKISDDIKYEVCDDKLIPVCPENIVVKNFYLHFDQKRDRFRRVRILQEPKKQKNSNYYEVVVFACDSSITEAILCSEIYVIPEEVEAMLNYPIHLYCQTPTKKCLELFNLPNAEDYDDESIVKAMIIGETNPPTAIIFDGAYNDVKFNIRCLFRKNYNDIHKNWICFVDAMNTGEIRQVTKKVSDFGNYKILEDDDVYIIDVEDFDKVHIKSTSQAIAECFYSSYLREYFEIDQFRERQIVPPNEIIPHFVYIMYVDVLNRYTRIKVTEMSNNKDKITLECIDFPVCKKVSILKDNITLYYLVQGLDIPPLYNTIKISSVTDKTDVDRKALINVASKGGRFILSMDKDISKLTYENGEDFNEKVMNESKEKSGNLNPLDIRLKTSIMVKRCNFNKSFAMKKGRLRSICVDDGKRIY